MQDQPAVLFVCLGNICRSPMAEAAFRRACQEAGLGCRADSAGTADWHRGKPPDLRAQAVALRHGCDISGLRARQVCPRDFHDFTHVLALDHDNLRRLRDLAPEGAPAHLSLLLDHLPGREGAAVADPYYGDDTGFAVAWGEVSAAAQALVRDLAGLPPRSGPSR